MGRYFLLGCLVALGVIPVGGAWLEGATSAAPRPAPADFVGLPTCMLYARGGDLRVRVHAPHAATVCSTLTRGLARMGVRWSLHARPIHHIVSPICLVADPSARIELQVIDDSQSRRRGAEICTDLVRAGWLILGQ